MNIPKVVEMFNDGVTSLHP